MDELKNVLESGNESKLQVSLYDEAISPGEGGALSSDAAKNLLNAIVSSVQNERYYTTFCLTFSKKPQTMAFKPKLLDIPQSGMFYEKDDVPGFDTSSVLGELASTPKRSLNVSPPRKRTEPVLT
jgi:hypothetical protein